MAGPSTPARTVVRCDPAVVGARLAAELDRLLAALDARADVEQVWLIGSTVSGRVHATSDLDLVVVQRTDLDPVSRALVLRDALAPRVPLDLFVYRPEEFAGGGRFVADVRRRGRRVR